jgi:hydroxymethylglutaryl-CoA lyase
MPESIKLIECPRDAWQGLKGQVPTDIKANYLKALINAGFKHIDAVSFVSPNAVPQMADSEDVLKELDPPDDVEIIGIVVNEKGAERAINTNSVHTLGFPYSISPDIPAQQSAPDSRGGLRSIGSYQEEGRRRWS